MKSKKIPKVYDLKTVEDILNAVNEKNIKLFMADFELFLRDRINFRKSPLRRIFKFGNNNMMWIDDGKTGVSKITFKGGADA